MLDIDAVGFDLDGTLYVKPPGQDELIQSYMIARASEILKRPQSEIRPQFEELYKKLGSGTSAMREMGVPIEYDLTQEAMEMADIASLLNEDPRLVRMLQRIKKEKEGLFLVTGSREDLAEGKLRVLGVDGSVFDPKIYSCVGAEREAGYVFDHVCKMIGVAPERTLFVGDRPKMDILTAKRKGLKTAIVNDVSPDADFQLKEIYDLETLLFG